MPRWTLSKTSAWSLLLCVCVLTCPVIALAQKSDAKSTKKADPEELKARALFKDAQTAFDVGEFSRALELFTEAYKAKSLPGFLFNIAQCHRQLGDFKQAGFFFGRFIDNSKPEAANVAVAHELLTEMNRRQQQADEDKRRADEVAAAAAAAAAKADAPVATSLEPVAGKPMLPPPPPPPVDETPVYQKGWFWGVVIGGAAVVAGGIVAGVVANQPRVLPYSPTATNLNDIDARSAK